MHWSGEKEKRGLPKNASRATVQALQKKEGAHGPFTGHNPKIGSLFGSLTQSIKNVFAFFKTYFMFIGPVLFFRRGKTYSADTLRFLL